MPANLLMSPRELSELIIDGKALVFDCRFDLFHPDRGRHSWLAAHIPGAIYAHLDDNLSGRVTRLSGRHPLPAPRAFAAFLGRSGWTAEKKLVAYDAHGGAFASRLWWLMNYFGLGGASLLDGGINAWMAAGLTMESGPVKTRRKPPPEVFPNSDMTINTQGVLNGTQNEEVALIDARAQDRFEGQSEPIDTAAGHIPGALNYPIEDNLTTGNRFKSEPELKARFKALGGKHDPSQVVSMCGSGVTACQNLFAMELSGLAGARLYVGSWSEWIRDPSRPILQGSVPRAR